MVIHRSCRKYYKRDTNAAMNGMIFDDEQIKRLIDSIKNKERKINELTHNNSGVRNGVPNSYFKNDVRSFEVIQEKNAMSNINERLNSSQVFNGNTEPNNYSSKRGNHFYSHEKAVPIKSTFNNRSIEMRSVSPKRNDK